jgi:hypothetical protein
MSPATNWKEQIAPDEATRFEAYARLLKHIQGKHQRKPMPRALHAKANVCVEGEFHVHGDIPAHARAGLFAKPGTYPTLVRFSNGAAGYQSDRKGDVRGIALKLVGVEGKKLIPGMEDERTQDFLLIRSSATPFKNAEEFIGLVDALQTPLLALPKLFGVLGFGRTFRVLKQLAAGLKVPLPSLAACQYFSALPFRYGDFAARCTLVPSTTATGPTPGDLGLELAGRLQEGPLSWDFKVQFFVDETKTPIEDASVDWDEHDAPYVTVGQLVLPRQDPSSARGQKLSEYIEPLSFDPWHALVEHRPLGNMQRARNVAYRESTQHRGAGKEPKELPAFG